MANREIKRQKIVECPSVGMCVCVYMQQGLFCLQLLVSPHVAACGLNTSYDPRVDRLASLNHSLK